MDSLNTFTDGNYERKSTWMRCLYKRVDKVI